MLELLFHLFAGVCGQNPGHTWAPGGVLLPCCQRCTGLYAGAGVAMLLHLWVKPRLTGRFLEIHGAFLLVMAPFGLHWVAQGPGLRTALGALFGFGIVTYLWLPLASGSRERWWLGLGTPKRRRGTSNIQHPTSNIRGLHRGRPLDAGGSRWDVGCFRISAMQCYFLALAAALVLLPLAAKFGGLLAAIVLCALLAWGAVAILLLTAADLSLGLLSVLRWLRRLASPRVPA